MNKFLDPNLENLQTTLQNKFEIPVYQRPYKWEKEQIEELFEDMLPEIMDEGIFFLGTVFMSFKEFYSSNRPVYEIVDGQQRLTTLALILLVLYAELHEAKCDTNDVVLKGIRDILWKKKNFENQRDSRLITAGNLEKTTLENIFNWCFDKPDKFIEKVKSENINNRSVFDKVFYSNILTIKACLEKYIVNNNEVFSGLNKIKKLSNFYTFLIDNVDLIAITMNNRVEDDRKKLFEIFESINAKGRKLEEIDLIKSYIFQNIDNRDYDEYLSKWGELIKKTDDNLEDYLSVFINAKIKVYKISIKIRNFKRLSVDEMQSYYKKSNLSDTLEAFIDDMVFCVDNYKKLTSKELFIIDNDEFNFFTSSIRFLKYTHPKPLLFRVYCDYMSPINAYIQKQELINITRNSFVFMFLYQTLQQRDSKETSTVFESIMNSILDVTKNGENYYQVVINKLKKTLASVALDKKKIGDILREHIGYEKQAKAETKVILCAYELKINKKFAFDQMTYALNETKIQVDHIAVKKPDKDNASYLYYRKIADNGAEELCLKEGSDFEKCSDVKQGMDYELFLSRTLHRTGNLQLLWGSNNKLKSNGLIKLPKYQNFTTYTQIIERGNKIADELLDTDFFEII